ncbi:hypothetical protein, partial [Actinomadura luteofluorescens]
MVGRNGTGHGDAHGVALLVVVVRLFHRLFEPVRLLTIAPQIAAARHFAAIPPGSLEGRAGPMGPA